MIINKPEDMMMAEAQEYVTYVQKKHHKKLKAIDIRYADAEDVELNYEFEPVGFERIRRITGYLVGTMEQWNDGKRAEEADRVKHDTEMERL